MLFTEIGYKVSVNYTYIQTFILLILITRISGNSEGEIIGKGQLTPKECAIECGKEQADAINMDSDTMSDCHCVKNKVSINEFSTNTKTALLKADEENCRWLSGNKNMEIAQIDMDNWVSLVLKCIKNNNLQISLFIILG